MRTRVTLILAIVALTSLGASPVRALDDTCSIDGGGRDTQHVEDPRGDATTEETVDEIEALDPSDLLGGWFARDDDGNVTANLQVATLSGTENNVVYYFRWNFTGGEPAKAIRWVSAQPRMYGARFRYGYLDTTTPGLQTLVTEGDVSGTVTPGTPGEVSIEVPFAKMGNPQPGDELAGLVLQARLLVGNPGLPPGIWPPPPAPAQPGGVVSTVDDSANANICDFIVV